MFKQLVSTIKHPIARWRCPKSITKHWQIPTSQKGSCWPASMRPSRHVFKSVQVILPASSFKLSCDEVWLAPPFLGPRLWRAAVASLWHFSGAVLNCSLCNVRLTSSLRFSSLDGLDSQVLVSIIIGSTFITSSTGSISMDSWPACKWWRWQAEHSPTVLGHRHEDEKVDIDWFTAPYLQPAPW